MAQTKQNIRWAVVLAVLAMAAVSLRPLRARGAEPVTGPAGALAGLPEQQGGSEKFVPGGSRFAAGATLEVRGEVNVIGDEVKLKNVCRWSDADKAAFEPIADLVLMRLTRQSPFRTLSVRELRDTLHDAGVNLAVVRLAGATSCTVARTDVKYDERTALDQWIAAREAGLGKPALIEEKEVRSQKPEVSSQKSDGGSEKTEEQPVVKAPAVPATPPVQVNPIPAPEPKREARAVKTLRDALLNEAAERMGVPVDDLQGHFNPADDRVMNLAEPMFRFGVIGPRSKSLGEQRWEVTIVADGSAVAQKATVSGTVRAWQRQAVVAKPLGARQVIMDDDVIERRALVDRLSEDPLLTKAQAVGNMADRDLKTGSILTARLIEAPEMVKAGQMVTITLTQGAIQAKSVARAMERGSLGQTVRVKNEATGNVFDVVLTGPQAGRLPGGEVSVR
ncbi:MAG: flagellar basal body P-ring formation chaperone FlgA [Phycisphaerae bacterium]|nr:flagellar basal body P-ring formation chaperone FlgA [Tepidisphaeraceae bacterium]